MEFRARNIKNVLKEFALNSYDFLSRRYLRYQSLHDIHDFKDFPEVIVQDTKALFVLSTGRCGTYFLYRLLNKIDGLDVHHEANPKLEAASKYIYENEVNPSGGKAAFLAARHRLIWDAYLFHKIYVETNNRLTFFAPFIQDLMPQVRFIHLVRHPGDFVRSGMRRGYYRNPRVTDFNKIRPVPDDPFQKNWASYSRVEKISWLWYRTNAFIEDFKNSHPQEILMIKSEHLFKEPNNTISGILDYMGLTLRGDIRVGPGPKNEQRTGDFPRYENWSRENKEKMKAIAGELAAKYDYQL